MDNFEKGLIKWGVVAVIVAIAICTASWIVGAYLESQTYNRLTGAHTTTWDAMWVELRVMDAPTK